MTAPAPFDSHSPRRLPRRNERVIAAPYAKPPECVDGVVTACVNGRVSVKTETRHGAVHVELSNFTWSPRRKAWVWWPKDVIKQVRALDKLDDTAALPRIREFAAIGDFVLLDGRATWVVRHQGRPAAIGAGANITRLQGYVLLTAKSEVQVDAESVRYDHGRRLWTGSRRAMA